MIDQDDVEFNVNNESILPDELMNLFNSNYRTKNVHLVYFYF